MTAEVFLDHRALSTLAARGHEDHAHDLATQRGTLRMDAFSYDPDDYRQAVVDVALALDASETRST